MRIAFVVPSLGLQEGQGSANFEVLRRIARANHRIEVFTSGASEAVGVLAGVTVHRVPRLPAWQVGNQMIMLGATAALLRKERFDLVYADAGTSARDADVLMVHTVTDRWLTLPRAVWGEPGLRGVNGAAATRFKAWLEVRQAKAARAVLTNSRTTADDLVARGVDGAKITVVPFGVDAERFRPPGAEERRASRALFGIDEDAFVVAFVGAHGPRKGLPLALDALAAAAPGEHLLVAGEHRGGRWFREARDRSLPVTMPGKLRDVRRAYWAADVLAYPTRYDAFGMAVLEAMACGLPVVVARQAGSHEIVRDAGIILDEHSVPSLRGALDELRADPERRARMSAAGRAIAIDRDWDKCGAIVLHLLDSLADKGKGHETSVA